MNEQLQDQAAAYVLDALPELERGAFEQVLARDPELQAMVRDFRDSLGELARTLPKRQPAPAAKARMLSRISALPTRAATTSERPAARVVRIFPSWIPWAAAALLAAGCFWLWGERGRLGTRVTAANEQQVALEETLDSMRAESAALRAAAEAAGADVERLQAAADALEQTVARTQTELAQTREGADMARLQVARLASLLSDQPQAVGVSLWNESTQQGVLLVENLPLPPPGKTYEVWVIDPNTATPISAGLFATDEDGSGRMVFRPKSDVQTAAQFAISVEGPEGSRQPGPTGPVIMAGATTSL